MNSLPSMRKKAELQGRVVRAESASFDGLEATARQKNAKGCFFERGTHRKEKKIAKWLCLHEESDFDFGEFAVEQVQIAPERDNCSDECKDPSCKDTSYFDAAAIESRIREASEYLVENLPAPFRSDVRSDAESIALMCTRLCPEVPFITLRLEIVQYNACWRWHQDAYVGRAIISYVGPGTCTTDDQSVRWTKFDQTVEDDTNEGCVPHKSIKQMSTNSVLLMKGDSWPNICGKGLMHKSPKLSGDQPPKRLILKVDLNYFRPPLDLDEGSEDSEDGLTIEQEDGFRDGNNTSTLALKRLASSEGFNSSNAWKLRRR
eukprot:g8752.t1